MLILSPVYVIDQHLSSYFFSKLTAVNRYIIITGIAPFTLTVIIMIILPLLILTNHKGFCLVPVHSINTYDTVNLTLPVTEDENRDRSRILL